MTLLSLALLLTALVVWVIAILLIVLFLKGAQMFDGEYFETDSQSSKQDDTED